MSPAHKRIANVILGDPEAAAFLNVSGLAKEARVSDSTVTRFATSIGYSGYPALSQQLQAMIKTRLTTKERLEHSQAAISPELPDVLYMRSIFEDLENIQLMVEQLNGANFLQSVDLIDNAQNVGIICARSTLSLGLYLEFYLSLLRKPTFVITGDPRTIDYLEHLTTSDVVIAIGFSRYAQSTIKTLKYCKDINIPSIVVTDYSASPLYGLGDVTFLCPAGIPSYMDSLVAPMALLQSILRMLSEKSTSVLIQNLSVLENIWTRFDIY